MDLKQFEGMAVQHARKNKEQEEDDLDLKNRRAPKAQKEKALKEVLLLSLLRPSLQDTRLATTFLWAGSDDSKKPVCGACYICFLGLICGCSEEF